MKATTHWLKRRSKNKSLAGVCELPLEYLPGVKILTMSLKLYFRETYGADVEKMANSYSRRPVRHLLLLLA